MTKRKIKITPLKVFRRLVQLASFIFLPGLFISAWSAMKDVYSALIHGSFSIGDLGYQVLLLIAVIPVTIVAGRFFCGYLCAFGSMGDALWFISRFIRKKQKPLGEKADRVLKLFKYLLLAFLVVCVWTFGIVSFPGMSSPWTIFGMVASVSGWPPATTLLSVGAALLLLIIAGSAVIERFFCRYCCPLGAVFSLVSLSRLFRIKKPRSNCGACTLCTKKCPMGIPLYKSNTIVSGECINCFNCVEACPRKNASANLAPPVAAAFAAVSIAGLYYLGNLATVDTTAAPAQGALVAEAAALDSGSYLDSLFSGAAGASSAAVTAPAASTSPSPSAGQFTDGVYSGSGVGFRGQTTVSVTVAGGKITGIKIVSYRDDTRYFNRAASTIISEIISAQGTHVQAVSGATFSSNGILKAVDNALNG